MPFGRPYMISYLSSLVTMSLSCTISETLSLISDVTLPWPRPFKEQFVIPMLNCQLTNQCTKFEIYSFSRSGDIIGWTKNLNRSRDHNHTPFRTVCSPYAGTSYDRPVYQIWNLYVDPLQRYERRRKNAKIWVGLGLGHQQHGYSIERIWLTIKVE